MIFTKSLPIQCRIRDMKMAALGIGFGAALAGPVTGATIEEDFERNPVEVGWQVFGEETLFQWQREEKRLSVTWDSSLPNSYFYRALPFQLTRRDDFGVTVDLQMQNIEVGATPGKPHSFELAFGFFNRDDATGSGFRRGTGSDSPNLVEFDYFPDAGFGATISPVVVSGNNQFVPEFNFPLELTSGDKFHIEMNWEAEAQRLITTMTRNDESFGPIDPVILNQTFTDFQFRVDAFSLSSYSDAGSSGSIRAEGWVDRVAITVPDPPQFRVRGRFDEAAWLVELDSLTNWLYRLERTDHFLEWEPVSSWREGTGVELMLSDTNAPGNKAFYRVRAKRP